MSIEEGDEKESAGEEVEGDAGENVEWSTSEPEKTSKGLSTLQAAAEVDRHLEEEED